MKNFNFSIPVLHLLLGLTILSCSQNTTSEHLHKPLPTPVRQASDGVQPHGEQLWKVNQATLDGVNKMVSIVENFKSTNQVETYPLLHDQLEEEILTIFTKCNMKGEGHNQLHNFLLPLYEQLEQLKSGDLNTCQTTYMALRKQLAIFPLYFE